MGHLEQNQKNVIKKVKNTPAIHGKIEKAHKKFQWTKVAISKNETNKIINM